MFKNVITGINGGPGDADAAALAGLLAGDDATVVPTTIPKGRSAADGLHEAAVERGADLIVVGSSSRGLLGRILAGDDVRETLRSAPCAVAVAPRGFATAEHSITRIGVGYDGGAGARAALATARAVARDTAASVLAVGVATPSQGVVDPVGISTMAELEGKRDLTEQEIAELPADVEGRTVDGIAYHKLAELSSDIDLLVVGSSRHGAFGRVMLGSTSEVLSREAACPLLVVPRPAEAPAPNPPEQGQPAPRASAAEA
jgi:nucleotide-binding universal stress UspA family protein